MTNCLEKLYLLFIKKINEVSLKNCVKANTQKHNMCLQEMNYPYNKQKYNGTSTNYSIILHESWLHGDVQLIHFEISVIRILCFN